MKFVCDRCQTKYSIADEKVRGRILRVRCKNCSNIVTVKEAAPVPLGASEGESDRTVINSRPHAIAIPPARAARPTPAPSPVLGPASDGGRTVAQPRPVHPTPAPAAAPPDDIQWFLALDGLQKGPFSRKVLVDRILALPRNADVHVWNENLDGWKPPRLVPVVAQEMQARQRQAGPVPPPPPPPRTHAVPPAPSQAARSRSGAFPSLSGAPTGTPVSNLGVSGSGGHATAGTSGVGLVAQMEAHSRRGQNGVDGHGSAAHGSPAAPLSNGESDAMRALNLGVPPRPQDAASTGWPQQTSTGIAVPIPGRQRSFKLIAAFLGIVIICVVVLFNFVLVKKPPPVGTAPATAPARSAEKSGEKSDEKTGDKTPAATGSPAAPPAPGGETAPAAGSAAAILRGEGKDKEASPSKVVIVSDGSGRGNGKKGAHGKGGHNQPSGPASVEPAPFAPGLTPEQQAAAARFGDNSRRTVPIRGGGSSGPRITPDQGQITRVVNSNKGGIKVCYQRALLRDSTLTHGKISVDISIGLSGRVKKVEIDGPASFRVLEPCIREVISRWVFPASSEEYVTQFSSSFQGNE